MRLAELLLTNVDDVGKSLSLSEIASYKGCTPNAKAVRMVVCRLRRKIALVGSSACIVATRGPSGYKAVFPDGCGELVRVVRVTAIDHRCESKPLLAGLGKGVG